MKNNPSSSFKPAVLLSGWRVLLLFVLVSLPTLATSCSDDADSDGPVLKGYILLYNEFGGAMFDFTEADMTKAGFTFGDVISITIDNHEIVMPYYDGYYGSNGEYLCVAYPTYPTVCFTANNIGLPEELQALEGHPVTVRMKEKGGKLDVQKALSMKYYNDRSLYPTLTDAAFANARTLWEEGSVILCPLKADPTADDYNTRLIAALKELPAHPAPYAVHCMEGKDRTGYVCALLEGLCGATYQEIVADYLTTYSNYYGITPEKNPDVCNTLVTLRLNPCLMYYAGVSDEAQLPHTDYAKAFTDYLLTHGMSQEQIDALVNALTSDK